MAYEMAMSSCFEFWGGWIKEVNDFMSSMVLSRRHFDMKLWVSLHAIQPRTQDNVANVFFPPKGGKETTNAPIMGANRSTEFLVDLSDDEYREVYNRAIMPAALNYTLMSKVEFQHFTKLQIPALRSVMEHQVLRWIFPSPKRAKSRYAPKLDLSQILMEDLFEKKNFDNPATAPTNLIGMVAKCVFEDVRQFAPRLRPTYDNYPTVVVKDPTTDKEWEVSELEYCKRFKSNWSWFSLAKMVARYTQYNLKASFMKPFNNPSYQCFILEDTTIPEDIIRGVVSPYAHGEVVGNPLLQKIKNKKKNIYGNKAFFAKLEKEFRRTLVLAADDEKSVDIRDSSKNKKNAEEKDHIRREAQKFKLLAKAYKPRPNRRGPSGSQPHGGNDDDGDGDGDGGSGGAGPKTWDTATLSQGEKGVLESFPAPIRNGQGPRDEDVEMRSGSDSDNASDVGMADSSDDEDVDGSDEEDLNGSGEEDVYEIGVQRVAGGTTGELQETIGRDDDAGGELSDVPGARVILVSPTDQHSPTISPAAMTTTKVYASTFGATGWEARTGFSRKSWASNVANLFWTSTGVRTNSSPFPDRFRSTEILPLVSDQDYRRIYNRVGEERNLTFELMSRNQFQQFKIYNVPTVRSSMDQVLRWLVPAGDFVLGASRYAPKRDLRIILQNDYFGPRNYGSNIVVADNLINLVAQIVFDHVEYFSPKALKGLDNYPTVTIKGKGDKENNISEED